MALSAIGTSLPAGLYIPSNVQTAAEKTEITPSSEKTKAAKSDAAEAFLKWARMNPIERVRAKYLEDHNLTEEQLAAMPDKDRQKIEDEIRRMIERMLNDKAKEKAIGNITIDI